MASVVLSDSEMLITWILDDCQCDNAILLNHYFSGKKQHRVIRSVIIRSIIVTFVVV